MKIWASPAALALLAHVAHAAQLQATPMARVAGLLGEMKHRIVADGKKEQMSYDMYACWCEESMQNTTAQISESKEMIDTLQREIMELTADVASLGANIKQSEKDIAANIESQREANQIRDEGRREFEANKIETENCIGALEAAIEALSGAGQGFLETRKEAQLLSVAADIRGLLMKSSVTDRVASNDLSAVKLFIEHPQDYVGARIGLISAAQIANNPFGDYAPQSTQIQGILKGMHDSFSADLVKDGAAEAEAQKSFDEVMATKSRELETLQTTLTQQQLSSAQKTNDVAKNNEHLDNKKVQLDTDETFLGSTKESCRDKARQWSERSRLRTEELVGVGQAINILTNSESSMVFENSTATFLQVSSVDAARTAAFGKFASLARTYKSMALARLALMLKTGGHFDKVIASIDQQIASLRQEEQDDIAHRDRCERASRKNTDDTEDLGAAVTKATETINELGVSKTELGTEIGRLEDDIKSLEADLMRILNARNQESQDFQQALKDDADAVLLLDQAIESLTRFYTKNRIPMSFVQDVPAYTVDPRKAPDTDWTDGKYGGQSSETHGVIAILEMIKEDVQKEIHTSREDDAASQKQYETERTALTDTKEAHEQSKISAEKELLDVKARIDDQTNHKTDKSNELAAEQKLTNTLYLDCSWVGTHFDTRRTNRKREIDGLVEAQGFLAGVDSGI